MSWRDGGTYAGRWRDRGTYVDQATGPGGASPDLHMTYDDDPLAGSRPPAVPARADIAPPGITDDMTGYDVDAPAAARGLLLDMSPEDHGFMGSHSDDRGAPNRQLFRRPMTHQHDETRETAIRYEITPVSSGSAVGVLRGTNSLPVNNPEGFRFGWYQQNITNRRLWTKFRRHTLPGLRVALATTPGYESPQPGDGSRYTSPFNLLVSSRRRTAKDPTQRRVPRPWDEDLITDGTVAPAPAFESWGL